MKIWRLREKYLHVQENLLISLINLLFLQYKTEQSNHQSTDNHEIDLFVFIGQNECAITQGGSCLHCLNASDNPEFLTTASYYCLTWYVIQTPFSQCLVGGGGRQGHQ